MTQLAIKAEGLHVKKGHTIVLEGIDFSLQGGSVTGLIGPSGSGKTTLMRAIVGVQKLTSGTLTVLGKPAGSKALRSQIGYVTQSPAIYNDVTVLQNIRYFAALTSASKAQVDEIIHQVQLDAQRNQLAASLSGGQKARVSLAIALLGDPQLLVLDEPTVGLDPLLRVELWQLFTDLAAKGRTLLISSHVMDEAEKCQSLLLLREGKLLWNDTRETLLQATSTASVGDAFMTIIEKGEEV